ncbi:MAG TPA: magnesium transporter [Flavipsychrobacter sp.]|nr:magnesium transporter [Flavipsychrobacter sp.]
MSVEEVEILDKFRELLDRGDKPALKAYLDEQNISAVAELIGEAPDEQSLIISSLSVHRAASTFKILDFGTQKELIRDLPPYKTAELLNELPADDRTSLLEELPSEVVKELIRLLHPEERRITLELLGYKEGSVGRLMTPDYIAVFRDWTVQEVLDHIRTFGKDSETIDVVYVIDDSGRLVDDIRIREFLLADTGRKVSELIDGRYIALNVKDEQNMANEVFKMNNRVALPVVDDKNILLGIITIDDILWVASEEFSEDMQLIGGTEALNEPYLDVSIMKMFKKRVGWLIILFLGELLTASAMGYFEDELAKAVVLALFVPLIISSGGNSGSQAATLIIQALAVGDVALRDWWRVMRREIVSGLMLGGVLGLLGFLRVGVWGAFTGNYGEHALLLGLAVGITLLGVVLWGTLSGSMLPLLLKRLGADPAVSSAPFIATLVDVTGLLIYFSVAFALLSGLML